ncbi:MAG: esterase-like activity of phytase family protein [Chloroflexota bacterium]
MRNAPVLIRSVLALATSLMLVLPGLARAQAGRATLVARAILPAATLADGLRAGQSLPHKTVNGLKLPFDTQPVGSVTAITPGQYGGSWLVLTNGVFDTPQNSSDYLLRIYTVEIDWRQANGGGGNASVVDWVTLSDPAKKVSKNIANASAAGRPLSGADFNPVALRRTADGSLWVAEASGPSLLHFNASGGLLDAPIGLGGGGTLQGMTGLPDGTSLLVAQRSGTKVTFRTFDTNSRALGSSVGSLTLTGGASTASGLTMINATTALIIEQDGKENKATRFKQIFLIDLGSGNAAPIVDLLNIADPNNISTADVFNNPANAFGVGQKFEFPFADISALYPVDAQTLMVVNNNNVPFGLGRSTTQADDTEYIMVQLAQPLNP